jgi:hypothetical protein
MRRTGCEGGVRFGSVARGVGGEAAAAVEQLMAADAAVAEVTRSPRGIEGEYRICVRTRSPAEAAGLVERLKQSVGPRVSAPVTILGPQGSHSVPTSS